MVKKIKRNSRNQSLNISDALQSAVKHHQKGELQQAETLYHQVLRVDKNNVDALNLLGLIAHQAGKIEEAIVSYRRALSSSPDFHMAHYNLGNALKEQGKREEAIASYRHALSLKPDYPEALNNLGSALKDQGKLEEAIACYQRALSIKPDFIEAHSNLGSALRDQGKLEEAIASYRRALSIKPDFIEGLGGLLFALQYRPGENAFSLKQFHENFGVMLECNKFQIRQPQVNDSNPDRLLRIGFVSSDLRRHPVGYFLVRVLENIDPARIAIICYFNSDKEDDMTDRIRATALVWRKVAGLSDDALAQRIRDDGVDALFDLTGHTEGNRLPMFARKPAPVQVAWIGYASTTGISAIEYLMSDIVCIPESEAAAYNEKIIRLPGGFLCYDPPHYAPQVEQLPALANGFITFGCFNNAAKINGEVIGVWCELLRKIPDARVILKNASFRDPATKNRYSWLFAEQGIDLRRIDLLLPSPHAEYLATYNKIDISLDPFPFTGGATSCESVWMGVPVVTLCGQTAFGRQGASLNTQLGLQCLTANTKEEYIDIALKTATDLETLSRLRSNLRCIMEKSSLCDGEQFARMWTHAVRAVWRTWCETEDYGKKNKK